MNTVALYRDHAPKLVSPDRRAVIVIAVVVVHALLISLLSPENLRPSPIRASASEEKAFKVRVETEKCPPVDVVEQTVSAPQPEPTVEIPTKTITPPPEQTAPPKKRVPQIEPTVNFPPKKVVPQIEPTFPITPPKTIARQPEPDIEIPTKKITPPPAPVVTTIPTKVRSSAATNHRTPPHDVRRHRASPQAGTRNFYGNNFPTQQGALTEADEAYHRKLRNILDFKWKEPPDSLLNGRRPQTTIELEISADGRVVGASVVKESGNGPMDESIRRLLKTLDRLPPPPRGAMKIHVNMAVK